MRITKRELINLIQEAVDKAVSKKDVWPAKAGTYKRPSVITVRPWGSSYKFKKSALPEGVKAVSRGQNYLKYLLYKGTGISKRKNVSNELSKALKQVDRKIKAGGKDYNIEKVEENDTTYYIIKEDDFWIDEPFYDEVAQYNKLVDVESVDVFGEPFYLVTYLVWQPYKSQDRENNEVGHFILVTDFAAKEDLPLN